ncbi:hypothetical protein RRG08_066714 [Elysia crispata]|uniref:Uncharacterized protein n=1 Tax=Elysia crispata TaxID=231223 RepID=A0AAE1EBH4_9GAST|nr:hypothetical protein RRG08_066714 [Elysia crispata]
MFGLRDWNPHQTATHFAGRALRFETQALPAVWNEFTQLIPAPVWTRYSRTKQSNGNRLLCPCKAYAPTFSSLVILFYWRLNTADGPSGQADLSLGRRLGSICVDLNLKGRKEAKQTFLITRMCTVKLKLSILGSLENNQGPSRVGRRVGETRTLLPYLWDVFSAPGRLASLEYLCLPPSLWPSLYLVSSLIARVVVREGCRDHRSQNMSFRIRLLLEIRKTLKINSNLEAPGVISLSSLVRIRAE